MKPGKPTTFATLPRGALLGEEEEAVEEEAVEAPLGATPAAPSTAAAGGGGGETLLFALPGNPVSALVTAQLLVVPALKRLAGLPPAQCVHAQARAVLLAPIKVRGLSTHPPPFALPRWRRRYYAARVGRGACRRYGAASGRR